MNRITTSLHINGIFPYFSCIQCHVCGPIVSNRQLISKKARPIGGAQGSKVEECPQPRGMGPDAFGESVLQNKVKPLQQSTSILANAQSH